MAKEGFIREAPVDELGIPLPIIPSADYPEDPHSERLSRHHEFYLYGSKKFGYLGGLAIRGSRLLRVEKEVHNQGLKSFHRFYNQSSGPTGEQKQFDASLLSVAGYMPWKGVDLWSGEPEVREMEPGERELLTIPHPNHDLQYKNLIYHFEAIRSFYEKYLIKQGALNLPPEQAYALIGAKKAAALREAGHQALSQIVEIVSAPVSKAYESALADGQLHPLAPETPGGVVLRILGKTDQRERLIRPLRNKLVALSSHEEELELVA